MFIRREEGGGGGMRMRARPFDRRPSIGSFAVCMRVKLDVRGGEGERMVPPSYSARRLRCTYGWPGGEEIKGGGFSPTSLLVVFYNVQFNMFI